MYPFKDNNDIKGGRGNTNVVDSFTIPSMDLVEPLKDKKVKCLACAHKCVIAPGKRGVCKVRFNKNGNLHVPWKYAGSIQINPIEQAPFMHVHSGENVLTFGMLGCNLRCSYCQNWHLSQVLRDANAPELPKRLSAQDIVEESKKRGINVILSSLNEPFITAEWAKEVFTLAKKEGIVTGMVSSGHGSREVLEYLRPVVDLIKIDLKTMNSEKYKSLGGNLHDVLETIKMVYEFGFWMEVVTLIVPGWNDSEEELRTASRYISSISNKIPWIVWNFHKDYNMHSPDDATFNDVSRAASIGRSEGLLFTYAGVQPGLVGDFEKTKCPCCNKIVINRTGYQLTDYAIDLAGNCSFCGFEIPGIWSSRGAITGPAALWFERRPSRIL
jgi:pyruvate formate lyase activating enzyme